VRQHPYTDNEPGQYVILSEIGHENYYKNGLKPLHGPHGEVVFLRQIVRANKGSSDEAGFEPCLIRVCDYS
jgi:hypothetical protein